MRERIKQVAAELLIKHGYRGLSFRQISDLLNTTRANLHYHFGSKDGLVEEVLEDMQTEPWIVTATFGPIRAQLYAIRLNPLWPCREAVMRPTTPMVIKAKLELDDQASL